MAELEVQSLNEEFETSFHANVPLPIGCTPKNLLKVTHSYALCTSLMIHAQ